MKKASELRTAPDDALIAAAIRGDSRAFSALVRRYEDTAYRFALKVCQDPHKASEVLQDTFINVFRKLHTFDGRSKFSTWMYTIVTNNCLMRHRRRKRDLLEESLEAFDEGPEGGSDAPSVARSEETPAHTVLEREMRQILDEAIQALPPEYRVVFVLRDVEERSTEETARIVGISVEATKSRLRRARAFLRSRIGPYLNSTGQS
jgi:RNA polymerase sigma-70 factor (ECF subfamily)